MDENKRQTLIGINYEVFKCCGLCKHGRFKPNHMFGECKKFDYKHLKHSEPSRYLSINIFGGCSSFELDDIKKGMLHRFIEFMK